MPTTTDDDGLVVVTASSRLPSPRDTPHGPWGKARCAHPVHLLEEPGTLEQVAELARGWSSTSAAAFAGIVTLEDLLEEIVGEIYDETDRDILAVQPMPECSLVLPGTFPIHDLPDINVDVTDAVAGDYTTIAGLVLAALGRIPTTPGDRIDLAHWTIEVTEVSHHAITEVRVRPRGHARGDLRP